MFPQSAEVSSRQRLARSATVAPAAGRAFRPDIQGLRAIAVLAVVLYHAGTPGVTSGYFGVDVFFVISGFLITQHLLDGTARGGRIAILAFYAKRIRRILPAALAVVVMTLVAAVVIYPPIGLPRVIGDAIGALLYVPNIVFASRATDYLADHSPSPFQHYWSLGIEEQFYLLWPLLLVALIWIGLRRRVLLLIGVSILLVASLSLGIAVTHTEQPTAFFMLHTRAWELLAGALIAIAMDHWPNRSRPAIASVVAWAGVVTVGVSMVAFDSQTPVPGVAAIVPVVGAGAALYFGQRAIGLTRVLSIRPIQFIGLISYSLYLVHWPLLVLAQVAVGDESPLQVRIKLALMIAVALPAAWLLFRFVETPFRSMSWAIQARPVRVVVAAALATCLLAMGAVGLNAWASTREGTLGPAVAQAPTQPLASVPVASVAPSNLTPQLEDAPRSLPDMYADGCHASLEAETVTPCIYGDSSAPRSVAIFGDSHAAQWLPALQRIAENQSLQITTYTKSSCPSADVTVVNNNVPDDACDRWRSEAIDDLIASAPDLVLISNSSSYRVDGVADAQRASRWGSGLVATVNRFTAAGMRVAIIADTPHQRSMPAICISAHPRDIAQCAAARDEAFDPDVAKAEIAAAKTSGASYVDLSNYICSDDRCPVVVADLLVYRDTHHLSTPYARYLAPALEPAILGSGD